MDSPQRKSTSRVITSLQAEIDELKGELEELRMTTQEVKKKNQILARKNDSYVDQLANAKHENDMVGALLKRKERRIADLEEEFNEVHASNENLKLTNKNLKIRCDNLQDSSALSTAEHERLKIAYDALIASQNEYKRHYQQELDNIYRLFEDYKRDSAKTIDDLSAKLENNDKDYDALLESLMSKRKAMDTLNVNKNKAVLQLLVSLAKAAKAHGEESKEILQENVDVVTSLVEKYPDLSDKIKERENADVDIESLLSNASDSLNTTFNDLEAESTVRSAGQRNVSSRRRRNNNNNSNKRNSMRIPSSDTENTNPLPRQRNSPSAGSRNTSSSGNGSQTRSGSRSNRNSQIFSGEILNQPTSTKNKRRSFYGGSNAFNSSSSYGDRKPSRKIGSEVTEA